MTTLSQAMTKEQLAAVKAKKITLCADPRNGAIVATSDGKKGLGRSPRQAIEAMEAA